MNWPIWSRLRRGRPPTNAQLGGVPGGTGSGHRLAVWHPRGCGQLQRRGRRHADREHPVLGDGESARPPGPRRNISPGGSRWFEGANETVDDPAYAIRVGHLTGVDTIFAPLSHIDQDPVLAGVQAPALSTCMQVFPYVAGPLGRNADIEVTWGAGGQVASVKDITDHVDVPFSPARAGELWLHPRCERQRGGGLLRRLRAGGCRGGCGDLRPGCRRFLRGGARSGAGLARIVDRPADHRSGLELHPDRGSGPRHHRDRIRALHHRARSSSSS